MIHPGSGNSLVPVQLRDEHSFPHKHHVVDISKVALDEMRLVHDRATQQQATNGNTIEYLLGNVLEPPLPLKSNSFQAWVDKGLIDALFHDAASASFKQCKVLFEEAHRLLESEIGIILVVSMAEDHSLRLIVENWLDANLWQSRLDVWELTPVSGTMRPFGFIMTKLEKGEKGAHFVMFHTDDGSIDKVSLESSNKEEVYRVIRTKLIRSRQAFEKDAHAATASEEGSHLVLATIEIKPYDAGEDLRAFGKAITSHTWESGSHEDTTQIPVRPRWQPWTADDASEGFVKIVPVGYGISKLVLKCVIEAAELDDLVEAISEWDGDDAWEEGVQSVDVDYDNTFPVGDASQLLGLRS